MPSKANSPFVFLSCCFPVVTVLLMLEMASPLFQRTIKASESLSVPAPYMIYALWASVFLGIICTILSFMRKEESSLLKYIGLVLNLLAVVIVFGPVIFALGIDVTR